MSAPSPSCRHCARVDDHFAGRMAPRHERALRAHLTDCQVCRTRYARHLKLAALDPRALPFEERLARGLGLRRRAFPLPAVRWMAAMAGGLALGLVLYGRSQRPGDDGFHARGGVPAALVMALDDRRTEVLGFRTGAGQPVLAAGRLSRSEELAFAYRNGGRWPRLMVFARDEQGKIYWFQPTWTDAAANPVAVPISEAAGAHELPVATTHTFAGNRLALCALATIDAALSVRAVEAALDAAPGHPPEESLAAPGRALACRTLEVAP